MRHDRYLLALRLDSAPLGRRSIDRGGPGPLVHGLHGLSRVAPREISATTSYKFQSADADAQILVVDDGRVAYAYLSLSGRIACGVWLYNHGPAPQKPDWDNSRKQRFLNPASFCAPELAQPIRSKSDIDVVWTTSAGRIDEVVLSIHQTRWAILKPNVKPGWCRLAAMDGPLARVMPVPGD